MAGHPFLRLECCWHNEFKVSQGRHVLVDWQTGGEAGSSVTCDLLVLFKAVIDQCWSALPCPTHPAVFLPLTGMKFQHPGTAVVTSFQATF